MSYVKTEWVDNQTPLSAENLNHIEDGIEQNNQDIGNVPVLKSVGRDSIIQKIVNLPDDVDDEGNPIDRTNVVYGAFSSAFGSRNYVAVDGTESCVVGGNNMSGGEDAFTFGYRCQNYGSQTLVGGYKATATASKESVSIGNNVIMNGTYNGFNRYCVAMGKDVALGNNNENAYIFGRNIYNRVKEGNLIGPNKLKKSFISGSDIVLGDEIYWVNAFGDTLTINNKVQDSVIMGYNHQAINTGNNALHYIYMFGRDNTNVGYDGTEHQNFYAIGCGLRPNEDDQVLLGNYNDDVDHCWLNVGCGSKNKQTGVITRNTAFAVCQHGNNYWVEVGGQQLSKETIVDIATQTYVNGVVGDINSVLDSINGQVI